MFFKAGYVKIEIMIFSLLGSGESAGVIIITLLCVLGAIIISLSLHEFAHACTAHKCGDDTAKNNGRMTVNPLKHIDIFGFLMLMIVGFGFAKAVPINPYNFKKQRRDYFLVSVAGITVNLILAFISSFLFAIVYLFMPWSIFADILFYFLLYMMVINIGLMIFNLIPIFPLDGFRIVESVTSRNNKFVTFMRKYGMYILLGLLVWSFVIDLIISVAPGAGVLRYFDVLNYVFGFLRDGIINGFIRLWGLVFGKPIDIWI